MTKQPLCSYSEIKTMVDSGLVLPASHSHTHIDLSQQLSADILNTEVVQSKKILEQKLNTDIDYFVYPFGKFCAKTHNLVLQNYKFAFRIGGAINLNAKKMLYRIDADDIWQHNKTISKFFLLKLKLKYYLNIFRGK